ncbi:hypothetical protein V8G54_000450 [Vigna mungo]|uniref:Uncharacterized protein n=1 Tax=Vigna mungo TaxID=3915 RepID=A0AAQ3P6J7_VIGMU
MILMRVNKDTMWTGESDAVDQIWLSITAKKPVISAIAKLGRRTSTNVFLIEKDASDISFTDLEDGPLNSTWKKISPIRRGISEIMHSFHVLSMPSARSSAAVELYFSFIAIANFING